MFAFFVFFFRVENLSFFVSVRLRRKTLSLLSLSFFLSLSPLTLSACHCLSNRNCSATNSSIASAYFTLASEIAPSWR